MLDYPEPVSTGLGWITALTSRQIHQVYSAGDVVIVLLFLHKLSLCTYKQHQMNITIGYWLVEVKVASHFIKANVTK